ncbi:MAG: YdcF family protein [Cytophagales bacterium]|nr:YdcF family protein [Cytophagales bacterium]
MLKEAKKGEPYDAIIVPGIPYDGTQWSKIMKARVFWAVYLYKKGIAKNVIFSGAAVYTPYIEAVTMGLFAEQLGIPKENIIYESKAEHSVENMYYGYKLAQKQGLNRVAIATDPFQAKSLAAFAQRYKINVGTIPIVFDTMHVVATSDPVIDASKAKVENFTAITDRQNFIERLGGTFGDGIQWEEGDKKR